MSKEKLSSRWRAWALVMLMAAGISAYSTTGVSQSYSRKGGDKVAGSPDANQSQTEVEKDLAIGSQKGEDSAERKKDVSFSRKYAWSKQAQVYHYFNCAWVKKIKPENLQTGDVPPEGRRLHRGCPTKE